MPDNKYEEFHRNTISQRKIIKKSNFTYRILIKQIEKNLRPNIDVLDIGCGAGSISLYLAKKGLKVSGIDISINSISSCVNSAKAMQLEDKTDFRVMNFPLEYPKEKFDFILCCEVLEHLVDDVKALGVIHSLLSHNGLALVSVPSKNAPLYKLGLTKSFDQKVGHLRRYDIDELLSKSKDAGFEIMKVDKREGILRNFLFLNKVAGKLIRFIRGPISGIVSFLDDLTIPLFGESDIIVVLRKK